MVSIQWVIGQKAAFSACCFILTNHCQTVCKIQTSYLMTPRYERENFVSKLVIFTILKKKLVESNCSKTESGSYIQKQGKQKL